MAACELGLVLWTTDIAGLASFLKEVAGMTEEERHPGFARLRAGTAEVVLHDDEPYRGHPWFAALAREGVARGIGAEIRVRVEDVEAAFSRALRMGGLAIEAPAHLEGTRECQVMGPDGYVLSLWQPEAAAPAAPPERTRRAGDWPTRPSILRRP